MNSPYVSIGKFAGTHGLKGELVLTHSLGKKTALKGVKAIFIKTADNVYLPWFLQSATIKNDSETYIKLEETDSKEAAQKLVRKEVWVTEEDFAKNADQNAAISLLGFTIYEEDKPLGVVEEVIEQPHQILCRLTIRGKEAYIPLHQESLLQIQKKKKIIYVTLPEGLLDIYLA